MSSAGANATSRAPINLIRPLSRTPITITGTWSGSTVAGTSPASPRITALSVAWPLPVNASEPYSATSRCATLSISPRSCSRSPKRRAATIGPTVCELDGPIPILKRSKTPEIMGVYLCVLIGLGV